MAISFVGWVDGSSGCGEESSVLGYYGLIFWCFIALYMFVGLYVLCEKYFVPTLTIMGDKMGLSEDVCGATLMAAGSSSPEFLLAIIATFIFSENELPTDNLGAAVFNMCVVIGLAIIFSGFNSLELRSFPFVRDSFFYGISALLLYFFYEVISPGIMQVWESCILICIWFIYITVAYYDLAVRNFVIKIGKSLNIVNERTEERIMHTYLLLPQISQIYLNVPKSKYNLTFAKSSVMKAMSKLSVIDENAPLLKAPSFQALIESTEEDGNEDDWDWDEGTNKWVKIGGNNNNNNSEVASLLYGNGDNGYDYNAIHLASDVNLYDDNGSGDGSGHDSGNNVVDSLTHGIVIEHEHRHFNNNNKNDNEHDSDYDEIRSNASNASEDSNNSAHSGKSNDSGKSDVSIRSDSSYDTSVSRSNNNHDFTPMISSFLKNNEKNGKNGSNNNDNNNSNKSGVMLCFDKVKHDLVHGFHILESPYNFIFNKTVPNFDATSNNEENVVKTQDVSNVKLFFSFLICIIWMAFLSWIVLDMSNKIGECCGISRDVMALTLLAIGASIPDSVTAILVAKQGRIGMAVGSALGCNVFGICICVGFTNLLRSLKMNGSGLNVTTSVEYESFIMVLFVLLGVFSILMFLSDLTISKKHGYVLIFSYLAFVVAFAVVLA